MCTPDGGPAIAAINPSAGSAMGGYTISVSGSGFGTTPKVRIGDLVASPVSASNGTSIEFRMLPGDPGLKPITVIDAAGRTATASFFYTSPSAAAGSVAITSPVEGAVVAAGPLAAELGEVAGHVAGQVAGDLKSTLIKARMGESDAEAWRAQIEGGRAILIGVHARSGRAAEIESLLASRSLGRVVHTQWED